MRDMTNLQTHDDRPCLRQVAFAVALTAATLAAGCWAGYLFTV